MATYTLENKENFGLTNFRSIIDKYGGPLKACRYIVIINKSPSMQGGTRGQMFNKIPASEASDYNTDLTYLCEATEFPGRNFEMIDLRYYGPRHKLPVNPQYDDINMTFICRSKSYERQFFDDWLEQINPNSTFDFNYRDSYCTDIELYQLSDLNTNTNKSDKKAIAETSYDFKLLRAYPTVVNPQPVSWAEDNFQRLTVTFTYYKWTRKIDRASSTNNLAINDAPSSVFNIT